MYNTKSLVESIKAIQTARNRPIVVALDGGSGAGKSTLASQLNSEIDPALIPLDDFFSANIPDHKWDEFTVEEKLKNVIDWERVRNEVIKPLLNGQSAIWHAFDFQSGLQADSTYKMENEPKIVQPASVILIEGAYSTSPELADLVDMAILIDVPIEERHARIAKREDPDFLAVWHQRWDDVEKYYFEQVRLKDSFHIVIEVQ